VEAEVGRVLCTHGGANTKHRWLLPKRSLDCALQLASGCIEEACATILARDLDRAANDSHRTHAAIAGAVDRCYLPPSSGVNNNDDAHSRDLSPEHDNPPCPVAPEVVAA
jgi:hypothetical protein